MIELKPEFQTGMLSSMEMQVEVPGGKTMPLRWELHQLEEPEYALIRINWKGTRHDVPLHHDVMEKVVRMLAALVEDYTYFFETSDE